MIWSGAYHYVKRNNCLPLQLGEVIASIDFSVHGSLNFNFFSFKVQFQHPARFM